MAGLHWPISTPLCFSQCNDSLDLATTRENVRRASALVRMDRVSESIDQYIQVVRKHVANQDVRLNVSRE
jgi:hypothetical protein